MAKMSQNVSGSYQEFYEKMKQDCHISMAKMSQNVSGSFQEICEKLKQDCDISMAKMSQTVCGSCQGSYAKIKQECDISMAKIFRNVCGSYQEFYEKMKQKCDISMANMFQNVSRSLQEFDEKMKQETDNFRAVNQVFQENSKNIYFILLLRLNFHDRKRSRTNENNIYYKITSILCANITGSHKLLPAIIYDSKINKETINYLKNLSVPSLEIVTMSNDNVLLEEDIFVNWYNTYFTTHVIQHQQKTNSDKVLLFLKHSKKFHYPREKIAQAGFEIIFSPVSYLPNFQSIHEKIINVLKNKHIFQTKFEDSYIENYGLAISEAWTNISSEDIKNSWNNFFDLGSHTEENTPSTSFMRH